MGQTLGVSTEATDADDEEPGQPGIPVEWMIDAAIGAASRTGQVAAAVGRSVPARAVAAAARFVAAPLTEEGHEMRTRAGPAMKEALQSVTPEVVDAVNINDVLAVIDVQAIIDRVDIDGIVDDVDLDRLLDRVDIDRIVGQVDLDKLLDRIDIDALLDRIDLNELVARIDVDKLIAETELGSIIAQSTTGVAAEALDAVRRQGVSLDNLVAGIARRVMRRDIDELPLGPPLLVEAPHPMELTEAPPDAGP